MPAMSGTPYRVAGRGLVMRMAGVIYGINQLFDG